MKKFKVYFTLEDNFEDEKDWEGNKFKPMTVKETKDYVRGNLQANCVKIKNIQVEVA